MPPAMYASPRSVLAAHGVHPRKQLGQNFLARPETAEMIVSRAGLTREETVLEIGAGLGALTVPLARAARRVIAVERDPRLTPLLEAELSRRLVQNVRIIETDALDLDLAALAETEGEPLSVFGNLPYNISSQIVVRLIENRRRVRRAVLMFQRELAQRLTAAPGGRDYGRITALLATCARVRRLAQVSATHFYPAPKVDADVLEFTFVEPPPGVAAYDETRLFRLIATAFGRRRKTIRNALAGPPLHLESATIAEALSAAGIDPSRRAETISPAEFVRLEMGIRGSARPAAEPEPPPAP
jgi:16S rRNA (adenine1518-N6/adenine1519-N6)-dimethyltransferase